MRRIILAAFAVLLLHAAPSMAAECRNLALVANGGVASASSEYSGWPATALNNGTRETSIDRHWSDGTRFIWPDWAAIEWSSPTRLDQIVVRGLVFTPNKTVAERTLDRTRVQYWDDATSTWVDIVGRSGQDNPILAWTGPTHAEDGAEIKQFDFASITTTRIRVQIEEGPTVLTGGYSSLDEIEAYDRGGCDPPASQCSNRGLDGIASASSTHSSGLYPVTGVNNGQVESGATKGYWNDDTNGVWPDWVQVAWAQPLTINRVVARIPLAQAGFPTGEITLRRTRIQYWDATTSTWVDVVGRSGQSNPILDWTGPIGRADGTETRMFHIAPVTTTKIRAVIEDGSTDGWSWLDELEAYAADCATPSNENLALGTNAGTAIASSEYSSLASIAKLNDGRRQTHLGRTYWMDGTGFSWPDWAGIKWSSPRSLNRIVLRGPALYSSYPTDRRTLGRTRVQYWSDDSSTWVDVVGRSGQDNPILNWVMPPDMTDGSEIRQFDFPTVATRRIRALIEEGGTHGWSFMEEIEAYWMS
ncbi:hypothetical protein [Conexibacter woesei]|uniref:F5/8 type C domain-containing protein n=1 Tax=Conexibacter woesei (strain DSM 14684 / CCUG 47730 / CIP 108061 / JCM 11494 / NBRC 100937 / ID131577) TaxID=469383 RepID=D3F436_CONWI|nr:hypothetical protein [Conexibacter woesei]ADB48519.1 hypothetical protein Cwoe_0083 [Conexibacter woesei DSM 14684]